METQIYFRAITSTKQKRNDYSINSAKLKILWTTQQRVRIAQIIRIILQIDLNLHWIVEKRQLHLCECESNHARKKWRNLSHFTNNINHIPFLFSLYTLICVCVKWYYSILWISQRKWWSSFRSEGVTERNCVCEISLI